MNKRSTRWLIGAKEFSQYGIMTYTHGDLVLFRVRPSNLSVLPTKTIEVYIRNLTIILSTIPEIEMCCLDSAERFDANIAYLKGRADDETNSEIKELLEKDCHFLDEIQTEASTLREFLLIVRFRESSPAHMFNLITRIEKTARDRGIEVTRLNTDETKTLLSAYLNR